MDEQAAAEEAVEDQATQRRGDAEEGRKVPKLAWCDGPDGRASACSQTKRGEGRQLGYLWRVTPDGDGYALDSSDTALIEHLSTDDLIGFGSRGVAKAAAERFEADLWRRSIEPPAGGEGEHLPKECRGCRHAGESPESDACKDCGEAEPRPTGYEAGGEAPVDGGSGKQSEIRNPKSEIDSSSASSAASAVNPPPATAAPAVAPLPIPRPADVDISLIDVVHNVRTGATLIEDLDLLGGSIETQGQIETVKLQRLANGRYRLLDGERRYRAAKGAGLASLRAEVYDQDLSEGQILRLQITTFATRKGMSHRDQAKALADLANTLRLESAAEIARAVGLSDDSVRKHLAYNEMSGWLQEDIDAGKLSLNKALLILRLSEAERKSMAERCWFHGWSEKKLAEEVDAILNPPPTGLLGAGDSTAEGAGNAEGGEEGNSSAASAASAVKAVPGVCRVCGCTEDEQCEGGCSWVDEREDLCSACGEKDGAGQMLSVLTRHGLDQDTIDKLAGAQVMTIGELAELGRRRGTFWWRDLEGLHGFGEAAARKLDDALAKFHFARMGSPLGSAPIEAPAPPPAPTPPADNKWKTTATAKLAIKKETISALVKAGMWCVGLVYDRTQKLGATWHQGAGLDLSAEDAAEVVAAIHGLWPPPPTAEHDQVNRQRADKVASAPITGTKAQTAAERHERAKADSDRLAITQCSPDASGKLSGTLPKIIVTSSPVSGIVDAMDSDVTLTFAGQAAVKVRCTVKLLVDAATAKRLYKAAVASAKAAGKKGKRR
jgi:ParB/RepB/Spo0J family partition protein